MAAARFWSDGEIALLKEHYEISPNTTLRQLLPNRPIGGIRQKAYELGLRKPKNLCGAPAVFEDGDGFRAGDTAISHLSEAEKGYLAGIIDGEGTFGFYRNDRAGANPVYRMVVTVANTDRKLIDWLERKVPGRCYSRKQVYGREEWRPCYQWMLTGSRRVVQFCGEIAPYLIIKKEQADLLAAGYLHLSYEERDALVDRLKALKSAG